MERAQTLTCSLDLKGGSKKAWLKFGLGLHESFLSLHVTDQGIFPESVSKDLVSVDSEPAPWSWIFFNVKEKSWHFLCLCKLCVHVESVLLLAQTSAHY